MTPDPRPDSPAAPAPDSASGSLPGADPVAQALARGDLDGADRMLTGLEARQPDQPAVAFRRAQERLLRGRFAEAAAAVARARALGRDEAALDELEGKIALFDGRPADARAAFRRALDRGAESPDLLVGLSCAHLRLDERKEAEAATLAFLARHPLASRRAPAPEASVLVLEALHRPVIDRVAFGAGAYAQLNTISIVPARRLTLHHLYVDHGASVEAARGLAEREGVDVIFNNVANAELVQGTAYPARIAEIARVTGAPVVNPPERILETSRRRNFERLSQIVGVSFPQTVPVPPAKGREGPVADWLGHEIGYPLLLRRAHTHADDRLDLIASKAELQAALAERGEGGGLYAVRYIDCRGADGLFRKYRAVFLNGRLFPVHIYYGGRFVVHRDDAFLKRLVEERPEILDEIDGYLADPAAHLGRDHVARLREIDRRTGLDFLGIDFAIATDGRLVVFEANAAMLARNQLTGVVPGLVAQAEHDRAILRAFEDMLVSWIGLGPS